tara:strand:- start:3 stop:593 length:591 start_codon:yes stop_codon:yes gene_type:complete
VEWLNRVTKYHKEWIAIMQSFGAKDQSEDIVQEVYIRLLNRADLKKLFINGELNKSYVYFALRNTWIMHIRKQRSNREKGVKIDNPLLYVDEPSYKIDNLFVSKTPEIDESIKFEKYEVILNKIRQEVESWHWYDQMLFTVYVSSGKSIRTLAKETKISRDSIFQTLKNCKERIKASVGEDWEDFKNKDYNFIKEE